MSLPNYHTIHLKSSELEELKQFLEPDLNLKRPVVFNLKSLTFDQQREVIGLTENFFTSNNISFKFPYPIYFVTDHEASITQMSLVNSVEQLPKFFTQKESKMNVKESHVLGKNKLLQQELKNNDAQQSEIEISTYGQFHNKIHELEHERLFLRSILNRISQVKKNG